MARIAGISALKSVIWSWATAVFIQIRRIFAFQYREKFHVGNLDNLRFCTVISRTELQAPPLFRGDQLRAELKMKTLVLRFLKDESGATAIEYGLIAAGIALAIIAAVQGVGTQLSANFGSISTSLK